MPRLTPPPAKPVVEPEPDEPQPPPAPAPRRPVGPWLQWQVAESDVIEGHSYIKLHVVPGYGQILELSSYDKPTHEDFPSLYIRAEADGRQYADLLNKKLPADLYVMIERDGNIIHNRPGQSVELVITEVDGKNIRGTFAGQVHDVELGGDGPISGKFQALVE